MLRRSYVFLTCLLPVLRRSPNLPRIPVGTHPRPAVCCAHSALSKCSRLHPTVVSATLRSRKCCARIIPSRSAMLPCFCLRLFFGARSARLDGSVRIGEAAVQRILGQRFFQYLATHPDDAAVFNAVMTQGVAWTTPALPTTSRASTD